MHQMVARIKQWAGQGLPSGLGSADLQPIGTWIESMHQALTQAEQTRSYYAEHSKEIQQYAEKLTQTGIQSDGLLQAAADLEQAQKLADKLQNPGV
jgi:hypothetical protein